MSPMTRELFARDIFLGSQKWLYPIHWLESGTRGSNTRTHRVTAYTIDLLS